MAERVLVSAGVFDRELDGTFRVADPAGIATALVSRREKGPAFEPVRVKDLDEDELYFGRPSTKGDDYGAYMARAFLRQDSNPLMQVRLLGLGTTGVTPGYTVGSTYAIVSSGSNVVALIQASGSNTVSLGGTLTSSAEQLSIVISGQAEVTASLHRSSDQYIGKVLNTDPTLWATKGHLVFAVYDYANKTPATDGHFVSQEVADSSINSDWTDSFITGATTTVISQPFDATEYDLFGVGNRFAGDSANKEFKVSVLNIRRSPNESLQPYGSFSLVVRKYDDNDRAPVVLESFSGLSLDPSSPNYVCRRIGDMYKTWNQGTKKFDEVGEYENKSKYIYVVPSADLTNQEVPDTALPWGFKGHQGLAAGAFGDFGTFPEIPMVQTLEYNADFNDRVYWGVEVVDNFSSSLKHGLLDRVKHLPNALTTASGTVETKFTLAHLTGATENVSGYSATSRLSETDISALSTSLSFTGASGNNIDNITVANIENTTLAKFTMIVTDGFDGVEIFKSNPFDPSDMSVTTTYQTHGYRTALDMLSNGDEVEISELSMPGVWADKVVSYAIDMVQDRGDVFYMADVSGSSVSDVIDFLGSQLWDTSYASSWYPWLKLRDETTNKLVDVPPTTIMPAVLAYNDQVAFSWFAPAGFSRGALSRHGVLRAKDKLTKAERDRLYDNRINPIATFPSEGAVVWGQKTLQQLPSALDRINVRRMLLQVRKTLAKKALNIVFEPNVPATWDRFVNDATPELERIQQNFGIDEFKLVLDESTTTADLIERNIMYGKIAIRPTRAAEFILLDFFVTNNAAGFEL